MTDSLPNESDVKTPKKRPTWLRGIVGLVGVVLTGAIGSAVWEVFLKPLTSYLIVAIIRVASFLFHNFADSIYTEIAIGPYERTSLQVLIMFCGIIAGASFGLLVGRASVSRRRRLQQMQNAGDSRSIDFGKDLNSYSLLFSVGGLFVFTVFLSATSMYEVRAEAYIRQLMRIDRPFIDDMAAYKLESQAAQISNEKDFDLIVAQLTMIAIANGANVPKFRVLR